MRKRLVMKGEQLPDPLVPAEVDLREFVFMPLDVHRLLVSNLWITAADDPRVGHAALCLWCEAWHQLPAGSLPDNDRVLYRMSMCPSVEEWERVRQRVMAAWVRCSDGRLYHPVVAEKAIDSWDRKRTQRKRTQRARDARQRRNKLSNSVSNNLSDSVCDSVCDSVSNSVQGTGKERKGKDLSAHARTREGNGSAYGHAAALLRDLGIEKIEEQTPLLKAWVDELNATPEQLTEAVTRARSYKPAPAEIPAAYLDRIVRDIVATPATPRKGNGQQTLSERAGALGLYPYPGEQWSEFSARVEAAESDQRKRA